MGIKKIIKDKVVEGVETIYDITSKGLKARKKKPYNVTSEGFKKPPKVKTHDRLGRRIRRGPLSKETQQRLKEQKLQKDLEERTRNADFDAERGKRTTKMKRELYEANKRSAKESLEKYKQRRSAVRKENREKNKKKKGK
jgi:hypothetical protein